MRALTRPTIRASGTSWPASTNFFARWPRALPARTAACSMSHVEIWGMSDFWQIAAACVPLPAPGAPSRISLIAVSLAIVGVLRRRQCAGTLAAGVGRAAPEAESGQFPCLKQRDSANPSLPYPPLEGEGLRASQYLAEWSAGIALTLPGAHSIGEWPSPLVDAHALF